jgi:hypothetical protein
MADGRFVFDGRPEELSAEVIESIYGVEVFAEQTQKLPAISRGQNPEHPENPSDTTHPVTAVPGQVLDPIPG